MSKIALKPNASGTGVFSLEAPNSNTDRTLTLPDEAGNVLTDVSDIETQVKTATNATGAAPVYACRAWVNFDGTGTVSIRESGNVSSITDISSGNYIVNFTTAMPDNNYCWSGSSSDQNKGFVRLLGGPTSSDGTKTTTALHIQTIRPDNLSEEGLALNTLAIFR